MEEKLVRLKAYFETLSQDGTKLRRPLTPTSKRQQSSSQQPCLFFSLPCEIRMQIYRKVIDSWEWGTNIHIHHVNILSHNPSLKRFGPGYLKVIPVCNPPSYLSLLLCACILSTSSAQRDCLVCFLTCSSVVLQ